MLQQSDCTKLTSRHLTSRHLTKWLSCCLRNRDDICYEWMRGPGFVSSHQLFLFVKKKNWMKNHCCYQSFLWSKMLIAQTDFLRCPIEPWEIDGIEVSGRSKVDWHMAILSVKVSIKLFLPFRSSPFSVVEAWTQNGRRNELLRFIFFA